MNDIATHEEFVLHFMKANPDWRDRLRREARYLHYDYESDIFFLRFGNPGFVFMTYMDHDDAEFEWGVEDDTLYIVAIHLMPFRKGYVARYPRVQAAFEAMCRDWGAGDWMINLPPQAQTKTPTAATLLADTLLDCARDPVPVPD